jgi:hypothetical protein
MRGAGSFEPDYPERLPYASMAVTMKNNVKALLVLAKVEHGELHWVSGDRGVLVTRNGRVTKTVGLAGNLLGTSFLDNDFFEDGRFPSHETAKARRVIDLSPGGHYGLVLEAKLVRCNKESVQIYKRVYDTWRFEERCVVPALSWEFVNTYWLDEQGVMWKSRQYLTPDVGAIDIEVTKRYAL